MQIRTCMKGTIKSNKGVVLVLIRLKKEGVNIETWINKSKYTLNVGL